MSSVHDVIDAFRQAPTTTERGTKFEQLMVQYFELDPLLKSQYDRVWRWPDWPDRTGADTGIDLVARHRETGEYTAVQCKFYAPDKTLNKGNLDSFFAESGKHPFTNRIIISTTDRWGSNAEQTLHDQQIPVERISLAQIAESPINWDVAWHDDDFQVEIEPTPRHTVRTHQQAAIDGVLAGFAEHDRGKLIMACGTGKTFTALKIAERLADEHGGSARVLFLVPSIALLSQTLREWTAHTGQPIRSFAVCSDTKVSRSVEDISPYDVPLPATTDPAQLTRRMGYGESAGLTVVFSTYQSLPVVDEAQQQGMDEFDLVICDEAHRTTGVTLQDGDVSNFVRVHDPDHIRGVRRLYMTATPRIFADTTKAKAEEHSAQITSMDDEAKYGPEFHKLTFGEAVDAGLLTDYKVLVLTVDEEYIAGPLQEHLADENSELNLDDASKIVGCWNGLAKRAGADMHGNGFGPDEVPMQRAVAFARDIRSSKLFETAFAEVVDAYEGTDGDVLHCNVEHVDGTFNALSRNEKLAWLKAPIAEGECRILTNARCLSEGVDVPALDAVIFLNPRNSMVDVIQSVGRVMRRAPGKDYGYIILPVGVPVGVEPEQALADNKRFRVIWDVLNALRSHDDRFNAIVNSIELNRGHEPSGKGQDKIMGGHIGPTADEDDSLGADSTDTEPDDTAQRVVTQGALFSLSDWRDAIYARIVKNVGTRAYWDDWAASVANMADALQTRIRSAVQGADQHLRAAFGTFVHALRHNLNASITEDDAVSMLAQHLITKPIFDALFEDYSFAAHNPVSQVMQAMIDQLSGHGLENETRDLESFYDSVRVRASGVTSAAGKQQVVSELYERFFTLAFAKQADALGIVYTPVEIVDFLLRAANDVLVTEFGQSLSNEDVHILDGFTGTGTFIVRLIQSGIIGPEDLARKYASELHANEIMLLAYYIAAVNIEATYHGVAGGDYQPFAGIALTDTFQISEAGDQADTSLFPRNNDRIEAQLKSDITAIVGNPPYSVGQTSANDNNANIKYDTLDDRIEQTYVKRSTSRSQRTMYDSYIRAIRWATDRIGDRGVVAFVSNGGWIDGNTADGIRLSLPEDYTRLYVYNLRGNQRTAGELSRKEGGKIFGGGSRNTVAMLIAIKNPDHDGPCQIYYRDIGDYLTREQKLAIVDEAHLATIDWESITPNPAGDWINQRNEAFTTYPAIGNKSSKPDEVTHFTTYSLGLATGRDAWACNFSRRHVASNMSRMIDVYNAQVDIAASSGEVTHDATSINWNRGLKNDLEKRRRHEFYEDRIYRSSYRPFTTQYTYFDRPLNGMVYQLLSMFPTPHHKNVGIIMTGPASHFEFTPFMVDALPNLHVLDTAQFFPRWTYEKVDTNNAQLDVGSTDVDEWGYRRIDNIADAILKDYCSRFGDQVTKDGIFYYVYGVLHSPQYRVTFAGDLKKMLPRIPTAQDADTFSAFADAGRRLADLHVGYGEVDPYPLAVQVTDKPGQDERELWRVTKMRWRSKSDHGAIIYNSQVTITGIPDEAHRYMLGSRTALDWIIDQYRVKTDKASGIVNDPNDWCEEHNNPRYIVDLTKRVTTVSVETMKIVDSLPDLEP